MGHAYGSCVNIYAHLLSYMFYFLLLFLLQCYSAWFCHKHVNSFPNKIHLDLNIPHFNYSK